MNCGKWGFLAQISGYEKNIKKIKATYCTIQKLVVPLQPFRMS